MNQNIINPPIVHPKLTAMLGVYFFFLVMLFLLEGMKGQKILLFNGLYMFSPLNDILSSVLAQ
jgi:hypothetical protein